MLVLKIMAEWQLPGLHLLMTSRDETTVRNALKGFTSKEDTLCVDYQELPDRRKDISRKNAKNDARSPQYTVDRSFKINQ
jgi:hypothetical protein